MKPGKLITRLFRKATGNFATKIFLTHALLIVIVSVAFTGFFIHRERQAMTENLTNKGDLLAKQLAETCRIGVFAENASLLADPLTSVMSQKETLSAQVFTRSGKLLGEIPIPGSPGDKQRVSRAPASLPEGERAALMKVNSISRKNGSSMEFLAVIRTAPLYSPSDALVFTDNPVQSSEQVIGFAVVTLDATPMDSAFRGLMLKSVLICLAVLVVALWTAYYLARSITSPLNSLKKQVNALGAGMETELTPFKTTDEIGELSRAFSDMASSLRMREAEKKHLTEQLQQAQKIEAVGQLAGGIAHDFNNILCAIIGFGALMDMNMKKDDPSRSHLKQILSAADRATRLIRGLLAFSRKQVISLQHTDLNDVVLNIEKMLARLISEDIELRLSLSGGDLRVLVDTAQIDQVLINLATNARDAMPQGGVITISTERALLPEEFHAASGIPPGATYALLTVTDTGTGMGNETREKIFEPFFTTKEVGKGTGLGLSMAYGIVKQHNGHIMVSSEQGKGSSFRIFLPMVVDESPRLDCSGSQAIRVDGTETLLIVEDDPEVRSLNRIILETHGYRVIEAVDGSQAVSQFMCHKKHIDLVVMDVVMPKLNGRQAYQEISRVRPDVKVIFMSGYTADTIQDKGVPSDEFTLLFKPIAPLDLLKKIRETLDS